MVSDYQRAFGRALGVEYLAEFDTVLVDLLSYGGSFVALDGARIVGTLGAYRFGLSSPGGGDLDAAGTTVVGVLPTHRRQGILRSLMSAHLGWARELGLDAVGLWASEPGIYPRFGFGLAARRGAWSVQTAGLDIGEENSPYRLTYEDLPSPRARELYEAHRKDRAGVLSRSEAWWSHRRWSDLPVRKGSFGAVQLVIAEREGRAEAYVQFRRRSVWQDGLAQDVVSVEELVGMPAARRALWRFLVNMDLVAELVSINLPVDEPLPWLIGHHRGARLYQEDSLWLCPLDLIRFLEARRYSSEGALVLEVRGANLGPIALEVFGGSAAATERSGPADISLDRTDLPALVWGEVSASLLADAGRLQGDPCAIERADQLFMTPRRPWCSERF